MNRAKTRLALGILLLLVASILPVQTLLAQPILAPQSPGWLEPGGLSVIDLVGFVPEQDLQGATISWDSSRGTVQYVSGTRQGNTVRIRASISPYVRPEGTTQFGCLGQTPFFDTWGSVMPQSRMWLYEGGRNITASVEWYFTTIAGQVQPTSNTSAFRYPVSLGNPGTLVDGAMVLPANRGCEIVLRDAHGTLEADFEIQRPAQAQVEVAGQQSISVHSYIGGGNVGWLGPFMNQMNSTFGWRHDRVALNVPANTDYVFVKAPPMRVSAYAESASSPNAFRPSSGTYRLANANWLLSVDHVVAMGIPWNGQWRDADQSGGAAYLPYFGAGTILAAPEYVLPPSVNYDSCMCTGTCSRSVLQAVYDATYTVQVYYLRVQRTDPTLARVPLRQVGPGWPQQVAQPSDGSPDTAVGAAVAQAPARSEVTFRYAIRLPLVAKGDDTTGCPCGWFAADGRMLDFTPPQ